MREVFVETMDHPENARTYTVPEAAHALGRSDLTFKRWISDDLIPEPILIDTVRGYRHYSTGELNLIAIELAEHEKEFSYYTANHSETRQRIMQSIDGYRRTEV